MNHNNSTSNNNSIIIFNNNKVKALQLDNKFKSRELDSYLIKKEINTRYSSSYTSKQNSVAEIINRVLLNKVRALLINSNLPKNLQRETILTTTYLYNRTSNSSINFKTPYKLKYKEIPNINNIRIFRSLTYYKEPTSLIKKLDSKASPYYLIGFSSSNIYKLYNPSNNKTIRARDYKIIESYYYKPNNNVNINKIFIKLEDLSSNNNNIIEEDFSKIESITSNNNNSKIIINNSNSNIIINNNNSKFKDSKDKLLINNNNNNSNKRVISSNNNNSLVELDNNYSKDKLAINSTIIIEDNSFNSIKLNINTSKNNQNTLYNNSIIENILNTSNNSLIEPKSYKEVLNRKDKDLYLAAIKIVVDNLIKTNTQNITNKPNNINIIKGRQVLSKKLNLDNTIKKYKARQVAKGFLQKYNINYKETFASTSKPSIIRLLLAIFCYLDQKIYTQDIK